MPADRRDALSIPKTRARRQERRIRELSGGEIRARKRRGPRAGSAAWHEHRETMLEECSRPVVVRTGEEEGELPAIQAVLRRTITAAINGNSHAQGIAMELFLGLCHEQDATRAMLMQRVLARQLTWEQARAAAQRAGVVLRDVSEPVELGTLRTEAAETKLLGRIMRHLHAKIRKGESEAGPD
jgi:hypothetical protein